MADTDELPSTRRRDPLTAAIVALLALLTLGGLLFFLVYAIWWLITVWNPF